MTLLDMYKCLDDGCHVQIRTLCNKDKCLHYIYAGSNNDIPEYLLDERITFIQTYAYDLTDLDGVVRSYCSLDITIDK